MTTRQFIDSIFFVQDFVKERLKVEFEEELDKDLTLECQEWIIERMSDLLEMFMSEMRVIK